MSAALRDFAHPAFAPYQAELSALDLGDALPTLVRLNTLASARNLKNARGLPLGFVAPDHALAARDYERQILHTGQVPTRTDNWHDVMNALVWLRFPHFKSALNAAHVAALNEESGSVRGRRRDALTILDESGVWVTSGNPTLIDLLRRRAWQSLFYEQRTAVVAQMQFVVVGHALLEKMLRPYPAITGKSLVLSSAQTLTLEALACATMDRVCTPDTLPPLPLLGIPGWDPLNIHAAYYTNAAVFRPLTPASAA